MTDHTRSRITAGLVLFLAASILVNIAAYAWIKRWYAEAKKAAIFPTHATHFAGSNGKLAAKTGKRIVLFGDSRIAQWESFPVPGGFEIVRRGINGETTAQMRARFEHDVLDLAPDIVVMQLGINDLTAIGVLPELRQQIADQCERNIRYFVDTLSARSIRTLLLTIVPPYRPELWRLPFWSSDIEAEVERLNRVWIGMAGGPLLRVVDTGAVLQDGAGRWHDGVNADTLHLTARGYDLLNRAVLPAIQN